MSNWDLVDAVLEEAKIDQGGER